MFSASLRRASWAALPERTTGASGWLSPLFAEPRAEDGGLEAWRNQPPKITIFCFLRFLRVDRNSAHVCVLFLIFFACLASFAPFFGFLRQFCVECTHFRPKRCQFDRKPTFCHANDCCDSASIPNFAVRRQQVRSDLRSMAHALRQSAGRVRNVRMHVEAPILHRSRVRADRVAYLAAQTSTAMSIQ